MRLRHHSKISTAEDWCRASTAATSTSSLYLGVKMVRIFSDRIRDRIRLEGFKSVRIRIRIFNIRYHIRIRILKSHIYDVDTQSYPIRHGWHHPYSDPNPNRNMKTNVISVISVSIRSVFIPFAMLSFMCQSLMHYDIFYEDCEHHN